MRVASLPMYDADPEAVDAWWRAISRALRARGVADVPDVLDRPCELDVHWRDPRLLLSQTCGYPLVTTLSRDVQVVGAFRYTAPLARGAAFFGDESITGSHRRSLFAVQSGQADIAAVDCVSLAALRPREPGLLRRLRVVGSTASAPGLPLVTSATTAPAEVATIRDALREACSDATAADAREALFIGGFEPLSADAWQVIDDVRRSRVCESV